jgi:uncharacterized protein (TIGR02284 family)
MTNQAKQVEKVSDVIQVLRAGAEFYKDATAEIDHSSLKATLKRMADHKVDTIAQLQPLAVAEQGETETGSSWAVEARKMYTKFASAVSSDKDYTFVNQLEEVEDKVLAALDDALEEEQPASAQIVLRTVRANAQSVHDEMKALQKRLEH